MEVEILNKSTNHHKSMIKLVRIMQKVLLWPYDSKTKKYNFRNIRKLLKNSFLNSIRFKVLVFRQAKINKK